MKKRTIALLMAAVMLFGATVGGTIAWLQAETGSVTNTFVAGNIEITLDEADVNIDIYDENNNVVGVEYAEYVAENAKVENIASADRVYSNVYEVVPGTTYSKDPKVTVKADSEECWLFVKFEEPEDAQTYYTYTSMLTGANGWSKLDSEENVWYRTETVKPATKDQAWYLLAGDATYENGAITVKDTVTLETIADAAAVELKWTAYAVQAANMADAATAWTSTFGA